MMSHEPLTFEDIFDPSAKAQVTRAYGRPPLFPNSVSELRWLVDLKPNDLDSEDANANAFAFTLNRPYSDIAPRSGASAGVMQQRFVSRADRSISQGVSGPLARAKAAPASAAKMQMRQSIW